MNPVHIIAWGIIALIALAVLRFVVRWVRLFVLGALWEVHSAKWRKNIQVGDKAIFHGMRGYVVGEIDRIYDDGNVGFKTKSASGGSWSSRSPESLRAFEPWVETVNFK